MLIDTALLQNQPDPPSNSRSMNGRLLTPKEFAQGMSILSKMLTTPRTQEEWDRGAKQQREEHRKKEVQAYMRMPSVKKHVQVDSDGHITKISKQLEKELDAPLEMIDDEDLVFVVAMSMGDYSDK